MFIFATGLAACGLLVFPSAYYALRRLTGRPVMQLRAAPAILRPTLLIFILPLVLWIGDRISRSSSLPGFFLPILHVLAVGLPVLWIVYLATRGLPLGSPQRMWGVFGSGLFLGPLLILGLEIAALIFFIIMGAIYLFSRPDLVDQLLPLVQSFQQGTVSEQEILQVITPWLTKPGILFAALVFVALVVPLIEEALKPIGVWLLVRFNLSPAAGFAAGALCGAGYAFFESLALTGAGAEWTVSVVARAGTAVIHITNTALMGWALTSAWHEKRYKNLALTYMAVVAVHGLWNGLAVINAISAILDEKGLQSFSPILSWISAAAPFVLIGIVLVMFTVLMWMNFRLRQANQIENSVSQVVQETPERDSEGSQAVL